MRPAADPAGLGGGRAAGRRPVVQVGVSARRLAPAGPRGRRRCAGWRWPRCWPTCVIVVTGGAVRLTGSGLGCPTWPSLHGRLAHPDQAYALHGIIEFTNRQLTFWSALVVLATLVGRGARHGARSGWRCCWRAGIPAQAVLGGITVLTQLNPWMVAAHFLLSMAIIAVTFAALVAAADRCRRPAGRPAAAADATAGRGLADAWRSPRRCWRSAPWSPAAARMPATAGSGTPPDRAQPGLGDPAARRPGDAADRPHRRLRTAGPGGRRGAARRAGARWLLGIELAQGVIGFVQYFTARSGAAGRRAHARRLPGLAGRAGRAGPARPAGPTVSPALAGAVNCRRMAVSVRLVAARR